MPPALREHVSLCYGLEFGDSKSFDSGVMNKNYKCSSPDGDFVVRIYSYKSPADVSFELEVLTHLAKKNFPSPVLVARKDGSFVGDWQGQALVVYKYLDGEVATKVDEVFLKQVGALMARLHNSTRDFYPTQIRSTWDPVDLGKLVGAHGQELLSRAFPTARDLLDFMHRELPRYSFSREMPTGFTHQDIKPENILVKEGEVSALIDFDNSYMGIWLVDLVTTAIWTCFPDAKFSRPFFNSLVEGYQSVRPLERVEQDSLDKLLCWRLAREVFIGPFVTTAFPELSVKRAEHFMKLYHSLT